MPKPSAPKGKPPASAKVCERPILFSGPMVSAILEGRKTQTRRIVKVQPPISNASDASWRDAKSDLWRNSRQYARDCCPFGKPGDRLWVREGLHRPDGDPWLYRADNQPVMVDAADETAMVVWAHHKQQDYCPSMFMPRWASRVTLELTGVRVERLNSITEPDAKAEGVELPSIPNPPQLLLPHRAGFWKLWLSIHGQESWAANPWVWVLTFKRLAVSTGGAK